METLAEQLARQTGGGSLPPPGPQPRGVVSPVAIAAPFRRVSRGLQGPLQSRRKAARSIRLRQRGALRSHRKKPFFHAFPGSRALSFGMLRLRPPLRILPELGFFPGAARYSLDPDFQAAEPRELVDVALRHGAASLVSTYNEPLITAEWAWRFSARPRPPGWRRFRIQRQRHAGGARIHPPVVDLYKVDLKSFDDRR